MGLFREREDDENDGVPVDLKQRACPSCRRLLQPWETSCPDDGAVPVAQIDLGALEDDILGRLNPALFEDDDPVPDVGVGDGPAGDGSADPTAQPWHDGAAYEQFMGRWSSRVAGRFLSRLPVGPNADWLDVGCGAGALLAEIALTTSPALLHGVDPSPALLDQARTMLAARGFEARLLEGDGTNLPLGDASVDATVSGLALNFMPDPALAVAEARRVTRPGGIVGGYVWDYAHAGFFLTAFWSAAAALGLAAGDERSRWSVCTPEGLAALLPPDADDADVWAILVPTVFADFDELWAGFGLGIGPAGTLLASLDQDARGRLRDELHDVLGRPHGPLDLTAQAFAFRFRVPR